jgi:predicted transcriptional regulator of viral defense system
MNYSILRKLKEKPYFSVEDLRDLLKVKPESARVLCSRYNKNGVFVRLKRNFYTLSENWENFDAPDFFKIANSLQVPSYISFMTALSVYELTTQVQRSFFESASIKRSISLNVKGAAFTYYKLKKNFYFDFIKKDGIFIASKEKALIDSCYLYSFGRYKFDFDSIDFNKFDKEKLKKILKFFPNKTGDIAKKLCKI